MNDQNGVRPNNGILVLKRNKAGIYAAMWMNPKDARHRRSQSVYPFEHFYEMSGIGKFMETESRLVVRGWGRGVGRSDCSRGWDFLRDNERFWD